MRSWGMTLVYSTGTLHFKLSEYRKSKANDKNNVRDLWCRDLYVRSEPSSLRKAMVLTVKRPTHVRNTIGDDPWLLLALIYSEDRSWVFQR